ncbi:MAG TPA: hypothetical protein VKZ88_07000 [Fibrobacteria bacterium]|jgi:hypothetical protein|nr:hypothetical protein [Fibrobacteria bacterium]
MSTTGNVERALLTQLQAGHTAETSPLLARVLRNNRIVLHNYKAATIRDCRCDLEGCDRGFAIVLLPNQTLYPRYCAAHRTEHRRALHRARLAAAST